MAFIPTPNAVRVVIEYLLGTQTFSNVLHFTKSNYTEADMVLLANTLDDAVNSSFKQHLSSSASYTRVLVYDIRTIDGPVVVNADHSGAGAQVGTPAPLNCAVVVTLRTNARGRTGRGRVYVAAQLDDSLTSNSWSTTAQDNAVDYITALRTNASALGWIHVIRSIQANGVTLNPAVTREVTAFDVRSGLTGTQRRRVDRL